MIQSYIDMFMSIMAEGGYVEKESNLRQYYDAQVSGNADVSGNAQVSGDAKAHYDAWVYDNARVSGTARVYDNAQVSGDVRILKDPVNISGLKHKITITETHIFIGCEGHTIEHWRKEIVNIGRKHGYTDAEIKQVIGILRTFVPRRKK